MLRFSFKKPIKSYTCSNQNNILKIFLPRWYSKVSLGDHSYMNDDADVVSFRSPQTVKIGKYSSIGKCRFVIDGDHNTSYASTYPFNEFSYCDQAPINASSKGSPTVGNDCWICDDAVIYGGVNIADGAIVAGCSVVTKDVPAYAIVAGNPAKVVKYRFEEGRIQRFLKVRWWDLPSDIIHAELAPLINNPDEFLKKAESICSCL